VPEGDTIWKTASTLERALAGRTIVAFETAVPVRRRPAEGASIDAVRARGKHLLIAFGDGTVLHTHMQMRGSWHVYRRGERWRRPRASMRVRIETDDAEAVCFAAPVVEVLAAAELERHPRLAALGPDLTAPEPDLAASAARLASMRDAAIGVALLDQRVAAGIGNVYKSEVLFACGVDPFAPVASLGDDVRRRVLETAARLLRHNAERAGPRRTTRAGRLAVYGRAGLPCARCGSIVRAARQGEHARVTYWCPSCQPTTAPQPAR
jgi:endonuclease-8